MKGRQILVLTRLLLLMFAFGLLVVVPATRIFSRVGSSSWLRLFALPPVAKVVLLCFVTFAAWPTYAVREHRA